MENLLSDQRTFETVTLKNDAFLNFVVNQEKRIDAIFKNLVDSNSMSKEMWYQLRLGQVITVGFLKTFFYINTQ